MLKGIRSFYVIILLIASIFVVGNNINWCKKPANLPEDNNLTVSKKLEIEKNPLNIQANYKTQLDTLEQKRIETTEELCKAQLEQQTSEQDIAVLEHKIEHNFASHIEQLKQKNPADYKTKYGNEKKRKIELREEKNKSKKLQKLFAKKDVIEQDIHNLTCQEKIEKIQEKYLFKKIDSDRSLRDLEIAKINAGLNC